MQKPQLKLAGIALAIGMVLPFSAQAQTYTLEEAVQAAIQANPEMDVSKARLAQAESALEKAKASKMPQVELSVIGSYSNNPLNIFGMKVQQRQATYGDLGLAGSGSAAEQTKVDALNEADPHGDLNTRIDVMVPVYNGGKVKSYRLQAQEMIGASEKGEQATKQYLTFGVYQAYEAVHSARSFIQVAEQAKKTADEFVRTTDNLVKQGVVVRSELLSAKVNAAAAEVSLVKAKGQEQIALDGLRILMGLPADAEIDVANRIEVKVPEGDLKSVLDSAMTNNPQLDAQRKQAASSLFAVDAAKADEKPSFNMMLRQEWNDDGLGFDASSYTVAGVFKWKIADFGLTENSVKMAQAEADQKKAETASMSNKIKFEIMTAWHKLKVAQEQVKSSKLAVEQAIEAKNLVNIRYQNGVSTFTELLTAQTQLDKARAEVVAAEFEVNVQKAKLRLAEGSMTIATL